MANPCVGLPPKLNQDGTFGTERKLPVREEAQTKNVSLAPSPMIDWRSVEALKVELIMYTSPGQ
jgi:hypothetical protein